ncbi:LacI family transcriptional regulator [Oceanobacillus oncorhynchi subsp. incaldanensis]|uniref:LacI family DNA-binding transcriptional regulator n=1 Tax=Oceanobacillus aidingensis TaxID=645964 RepID=A0ABV9JWY1_9BACI|nr:LacI family DNA-binding transcriptional regulator [Oceanobacillus oncorhynchi]UUI39221.1 LacI family transcriptional regulator [Oceanobacillus oncorhynchi]GIO17954.1 LacI family transcriptional regulator [Oceanobacillus oncorhynchi subsp. incaldanensis]
MPTIQDVAKHAGVSVATVSRVLNNPSSVAELTRKKVEQSIRELDYSPNILGRNLRNAESKMLLVLLPKISNQFYLKIVEGIEEKALEYGYNILLCQTHSKLEREKVYFDLLKNQLAVGAITMDPTIDRQVLVNMAKRYPFVQCSEYVSSKNLPYVTIDSELAAYQVTKYLLKQGHQRIGLINVSESFLYARDRKKGYLRALKEFHIEPEEDWFYSANDVSLESGQQVMRSILNKNKDLTAVFAVSDMLAIGALKELNTRGIDVPNEMAVVGFDKIEFTSMTYPSLTTVAQPMYKMGEISVDMLIKKIQGEEVEDIILEHELIIREST